jgi:hypothetical protein
MKKQFTPPKLVTESSLLRLTLETKPVSGGDS